MAIDLADVEDLAADLLALADYAQAQLDAATTIPATPNVFEEVYKELVTRW